MVKESVSKRPIARKKKPKAKAAPKKTKSKKQTEPGKVCEKSLEMYSRLRAIQDNLISLRSFAGGTSHYPLISESIEELRETAKERIAPLEAESRKLLAQFKAHNTKFQSVLKEQVEKYRKIAKDEQQEAREKYRKHDQIIALTRHWAEWDEAQFTEFGESLGGCFGFLRPS